MFGSHILASATTGCRGLFRDHPKVASAVTSYGSHKRGQLLGRQQRDDRSFDAARVNRGEVLQLPRPGIRQRRPSGTAASGRRGDHAAVHARPRDVGTLGESCEASRRHRQASPARRSRNKPDFFCRRRLPWRSTSAGMPYRSSVAGSRWAAVRVVMVLAIASTSELFRRLLARGSTLGRPPSRRSSRPLPQIRLWTPQSPSSGKL